jgi:hypothetical protein
MPSAREGFDRERVSQAFDAFRRHVTSLQMQLRVLQNKTGKDWGNAVDTATEAQPGPKLPPSAVNHVYVEKGLGAGRSEKRVARS